MKRLILVRHAKSGWGYPTQDDFDRPLNERGLRDLPLAGQRLADYPGSRSGKIRMECSPAERAKTTAKALAVALNLSERDIVWNQKLYLCPPPVWLDEIRQWNDEVETVVSVGHNPGITTLVNRFTRVSLNNMPTASMAAIEFEVAAWSEVDWGKGKLMWFDYPELHDSTEK